ncbi:MAG: hypothetical protein KDB01_21010 [Planctomycetaceae bacterium]|nr:hypothetical protein [Planctomycetaceae bacterium]
MNTHRIKLKRSPQSFTVDQRTVRVEGGTGVDHPRASGSPAHTSAVTSRQKPATVAKVIQNPVDRPVTPISRSTAVPLLSNTSQEIVTAEQVGLGRADPEEISRLQQILADATEAIQELQAQQRQALSETQEVAVELAAAAASWLVGVAIDRNMFAIDDLIMKSLDHLGASQPVKVRLNPADHTLLQTLMKDSACPPELTQVFCAGDHTVSRGTVRVEAGRRILLTDMNTRLEEVRRTWMEKLDASQIERRGDDSVTRTLRRFPERRETA